MALQAFIDDSTGPSGVYVLAGYIAPADTWANFIKEWKEMLPFGVRASDGNFHFKMSEMAQTPERMERANAFWRIIQSYELQPISCKVSKHDIDKAIARLWCLKRRIDWGPLKDPFFFAFRALIDCVHLNRAQIPLLRNEGKIDFIFDNHPRKGMIIKAWDSYVKSKPCEAQELFGDTPRFEDDREFLPLQAADFWAWWMREWHEENCPITEIDGKPYMIARGLLTAKSNKAAIIISYSEDHIVENLEIIAQASHPGVVLYDEKKIKNIVFSA